MRIREARPGEDVEVARVLAAAFEQYRPASTGVAPERRAAFEGYLQGLADVARDKNAKLLVAEHGGCIVGTASLFLPQGHTAYAPVPWPDAWAVLRLVGVHPDHRGNGVGRRLTEAQIERARRCGAPVVALHTSPEFEVSRGMYRRMGWQRDPAHDFAPAPDVVAEAYILPLRHD